MDKIITTLIFIILPAEQKNIQLKVPFISKSYGDSASCEKELVYADRLRIPMLPILIQSGYDPNSWVGLIITRWKYLDFTNGKMQNNFAENDK